MVDLQSAFAVGSTSLAAVRPVGADTTVAGR